MHLRDLELKIPEKLIATKQAKPRDASKLVIVDDTFKVITFNEIVNLLNPHDALIFNNTKLINAHIDGKINNRKVSVNLNKIIDRKKVIWSVFLKSNKSPKINDKIIFNRNFSALVIHEELNKNLKVFYIKFNCKLEKFKKKLVNLGKIPLPPYITKKRNRTLQDQKNYQTVFAKKEGAVAAPTASLHFTKKLINKLKKKTLNLLILLSTSMVVRSSQ